MNGPTSDDREFRSAFTACLREVAPIGLRLQITVPVTPDPFAGWRSMLATHGAGLISVAEPHTLQWPGRWIGISRNREDQRTAPRVMFGVPPGVIWSPSPTVPDAIDEGWVLAAHRPALGPVAPEPLTGVVRGLLTAPAAEQPMLSHEAVRVTEHGIIGDRYETAAGTFSHPDATGNALTLVDEDVLASALGPGSAPWLMARRNVVTSGIDLDHIIGRHFTIGGVTCFGQRRCEPCAHLQRLTEPGVLRALVHRGGLRADIVTPGEIRVGDAIATIEPAP